MAVSGRPAKRWAQWLLSVAGLALTAAANAECTAPTALQANLHAHPTIENAIAVGNWFASHQQFGCAVDVFRGALHSDPKSAQLHYLEGLALSGWGHTTEAIPELEEATRLEPAVLKPHLVLASLYQQSGRAADSERQWKQALSIDPHSSVAFEGMGDLLMARKDYIGVVGLLRPAPRTESLALMLIEACTQLEMLDEASQAASDAMKLAPHSLPLANAASVVMVRQRHYQEAVKVLEDALAHHPNDKDAQFLFFRILVLTADIKRARPLGLKLLAEFPHNADILYLNGVVDRSLGDYPLSKKHLEESVKIEPSHANARFNLGIVLVLLKEWPEAKEQLEQCIALGAIEPQAHFELAKALRALGETQRAQEESQKYQQLKKADDDAIEAASKAAQGDDDLTAGKVQDAIAHYREACEVAPNFGGYKYKLSVALDRAGDTDGEKAQLEAAVALDPRLASAQNQLGYLLSRSGDIAGAEEHFRMAVRSAPGWTEAWINYAATLAGEAHLAEAKDAVAIALRLEPQNAEARELSNQLEHDPAAQQAHP